MLPLTFPAVEDHPVKVAPVNRRTLVSYAQNGEDIVLWRALGHVPNGRYVDVGANAPEDDSVTKLLYDKGWSGVNVEPVPEFAERLRVARDRDVVIEAAVTRVDGETITIHELPETGLSTLRAEFVTADAAVEHGVRALTVSTRTLQSIVDEHLGAEEVHFCKVDVEGAEADVLASVDLGSWRPWVLVIEATRPNSAEPTHVEWESTVLAAGYRFCMFDGLSRWYVSDEHADVQAALSFPACILDDYEKITAVRARECSEVLEQKVRHLENEVSQLQGDVLRWRGAVLEYWAAAVDRASLTIDDDPVARAELEAMRHTLSWRVTTPLRAIRAQQLRVRR
jgi:FkbM family methyltransferase